VAEDERALLFGTQVGEPVPGEEAFNGHDPTVTIGCHGPEKGVGSGLHVAVQHDFTIVAQDADVHAAGMQIDTAVKWVWMGVESHEVSSFVVNRVFPPPAYHWGMLRGRPHTLSKARSGRPTVEAFYQVLSLSPVSCSLGAFGSRTVSSTEKSGKMKP
jgi:hypothetical protein